MIRAGWGSNCKHFQQIDWCCAKWWLCSPSSVVLGKLFFVLVFNGKIEEHIFTSFPIHIQYLCRWEKELSSKLANTAGWQHTIQRSAGSLGHMGDSWDTNQRESRFWVYLVQDESILHCTISMWWSYFKSGDSNNFSVGCFTVAAGSLSTFPHSALGLLDNPEQSFSSPSHLQKTLCNPS